MTVFHCFRDSKCEWNKGLRDFVEQFNATFNTDYSLLECLDVSDSTQSQPEVLLKSTGNECMVVECKKIVYPPNYFKNHRLLHYFYDQFREGFQARLNSKIPLDVYELIVDSNCIFQQSEREITITTNQILDDILKRSKAFLDSKKICADSPIPWYFRRLPNYERDENTPESGLIVSFPQDIVIYSLSETKQEISKQIAKILEKVEVKFKNYSHCLKTLVLEICGESFSILDSDTIDDIINLAMASLPLNLDQIWLAEPEWISDQRYIITYRRVR